MEMAHSHPTFGTCHTFTHSVCVCVCVFVCVCVCVYVNVHVHACVFECTIRVCVCVCLCVCVLDRKCYGHSHHPEHALSVPCKGQAQSLGGNLACVHLQ